MKERDELIHSLIVDGWLKTPRIIEAFRAIDRADFVSQENHIHAYENRPLPIGAGQTISQPLTVAFMLEKLQPMPGDTVLDVGSGSGWTTALLSHIVGSSGSVIGIERIPSICNMGQKNISKYEFGNQKIVCGNATDNISEYGPYDKILSGASASKAMPDTWRKALKSNGIIVAPVKNSVWAYKKTQEGEWEETEYAGFSFVPLIQSETNTPNIKPIAAKKGVVHFFAIGIFALMSVMFFISAFLAYEIFTPHSEFEGTISVEIPQGSGSRIIGNILKNTGAIRSKWAFVTYVSLRGQASHLKPGKFILHSNMAIPEITATILGGSRNEIIITIPEGWSIRDIAKLFEDKGIFSSKEFFAIIGAPGIDYRTLNADLQPQQNFKKQFDFLNDKPDYVGLEGYLFPDTYRFFSDTEAENAATPFLKNFDRKLSSEIRDEIKTQKKTIFEIVTMASLIEKEIISDEDRALVSGILWKRNSIGMPLQVDATIAYITGKKTSKISREETQIDSPFNTYKYAGLPLGPISNPGVSALRAAIYPVESPYFFYLTAPDGGTIFSRTLDEHNEAKAKYLR